MSAGTEALKKAMDSLDLDAGIEINKHGADHDKYMEVCHKIRRVYSTPEGSEVLDWMLLAFSLQVLPGYNDGEPAFREGQRDVPRQVLLNIQISKRAKNA